MRQIDRDEVQPLGRKVERPAPEPRPEWLPTGTPGIERHRDTGHLRNVTPPPPADPIPWPYFPVVDWEAIVEAIAKGG